jgi:peptide-methionine (R)-S-oxide reductase
VEKMEEKIEKTEEEYKKELSPELYNVARGKGTEPAFTGKYTDTEDKGMYKCAVCGQELFSSETKFHSGTGWPSFTEAIPGAVEFHHDDSYGINRLEVSCSRCGSHLGHIFDDGPEDKGGKRYCINSVCLDLEKKEK